MNWADEVEADEEILAEEEASKPPAWQKPAEETAKPAPSLQQVQEQQAMEEKSSFVRGPPQRYRSEDTHSNNQRFKNNDNYRQNYNQGGYQNNSFSSARSEGSGGATASSSSGGRGAASDRWKTHSQRLNEQPAPANNHLSRRYGSADPYDHRNKNDRFDRGNDLSSQGSWRSNSSKPSNFDGGRPPPPPIQNKELDRRDTGFMRRRGSHSSHNTQQQQQQGFERGGGRQQHSNSNNNNIVQGPITQGIVTSLKDRSGDKFGFIQVVSDENIKTDVFFHFEEVAKTDYDPSNIKVGDEVEFELVTGRNNRLSANHLKFLEKGTIKEVKRMDVIKPDRMQGVVIHSGDSFGFIQVVSKEDIKTDVFFHFDEVAKGGFDPSKIRIGDEVEFNLVTGRDNRLSANQLKFLDKGTIEYDKRIEDDSEPLYGIVINETLHTHRGGGNNNHKNNSNNNEFLESKGNARYWQGRIIVMTKDQVENLDSFLPEDASTKRLAKPDNKTLVCFGNRGIMKNKSEENDNKNKPKVLVYPGKGDFVKFDLAKEIATGTIHAINLSIVRLGKDRIQGIIDRQIENKNVKRERGKICALVASNSWNPKSYGMIECEERPEKVYFAYRDLPEEFQPKSIGGGSQQQQEDNNKKDKVGVASNDWREKDKKGSASKNNDENKNNGKREQQLAVGVELEFYCINDPVQPERLIATKLTTLEPGTVCFEEIVKKDSKGKLLILPRDGDESGGRTSHGSHSSNSHHKQKVVGELLCLNENEDDENGDATAQIVKFGVEDLLLPGPKTQQNDIVIFDLFKAKRTNQLYARNIQLFEPTGEKLRIDDKQGSSWLGKTKREAGIVTNLRESFGFINCLDRDAQIFFPLKEVITYREHDSNRSVRSTDMLRIGDSVSFQVIFDNFHGNNNKYSNNNNSNNDRRLVAVRVMKTKHDNRFIQLGEEKITGMISKLPSGSKFDNKNNRRRNNNNNSSHSQPENGLIKAVPSHFLYKELYDTLDKFVKSTLLKENGKTVNVLHITTSGKKHNHKSSSKKFGKSNAEDTYELKVPPNVMLIARDYCSWFGLKIQQPSRNKQQPTDIIIVERFNKKKSNNNSKAQDDKTTSTKQGETEEGEEEEEIVDDNKDEVVDDESNDNNKSTIVKKFEATITFGNAASLDKRPFQIGDKVEFSLFFDKSTKRHVAKSIKMIEPAKPKEVPVVPVKRRPNTETGIVACVHDNGFGFIQSCDRTDRLFFPVAECEGNYRSQVQPGDEVEYIFKYSESRGDNRSKAMSLRRLPKGTVVFDEPVYNEETKERETFRGFIVREPKLLSESKNKIKWKDDHPDSVKVSQIHLPAHYLGRLINSSSAPIIEEEEEKPDWRRMNELHNMVKKFKENSEEKIMLIDPLVFTKSEQQELVRFAKGKPMNLFIGKLENQSIIARRKHDFISYKQNKSKKEDDDEEEEEDGEQENLDETDAQSDNNIDKEEEDDDDDDDDDDEDIDSKKIIKAENKNKTNTGKQANGTQSSYYLFSLSDIIKPKTLSGKNEEALEQWIPTLGDEIEFQLCQNIANKKIRATNVKLVKASAKIYRGIIEGNVVGKIGFVRPLVAGVGSEGLFGEERDVVDESFKPGAGGRDGTIRFDRSEVRDGTQLGDGDEVEYTLIINSRTKEAKATRIRLIKRAPETLTSQEPPKVNQQLIRKLREGALTSAAAKFHDAKKPDGTKGFPAGRGRNLPLRTKLRVTAKEFTPVF